LTEEERRYYEAVTSAVTRREAEQAAASADLEAMARAYASAKTAAAKDQALQQMGIAVDQLADITQRGLGELEGVEPPARFRTAHALLLTAGRQHVQSLKWQADAAQAGDVETFRKLMQEDAKDSIANQARVTKAFEEAMPGRTDVDARPQGNAAAPVKEADVPSRSESEAAMMRIVSSVLASLFGLGVVGLVVWSVASRGHPCPKCNAKMAKGQRTCRRCGLDVVDSGRMGG